MSAAGFRANAMKATAAAAAETKAADHLEAVARVAGPTSPAVDIARAEYWKVRAELRGDDFSVQMAERFAK